MERISSRNNNENNGNIQLPPPPPPPYTSVVYKLDETDLERNPPPAYSDVDGLPVTYINNYPGPPLTDGQVQVIQDAASINHNTIISKKLRIYLLLNGIITILIGTAAIGIQIGIIASNSIIYYYYGFWGGAMIICIGLSSVVVYKRHRYRDNSKLFQSFFWQMIIVAIVFAIGIILIKTDKCNDDDTDGDGNNSSCLHAYVLLNGFLIGVFALAFLQSIINTFVFGTLKRQHSMISNSFS